MFAHFLKSRKNRASFSRAVPNQEEKKQTYNILLAWFGDALSQTSQTKQKNTIRWKAEALKKSKILKTKLIDERSPFTLDDGYLGFRFDEGHSKV